MNSNRRQTLVAFCWPEATASRARFAALAVIGTLALAISAKVQVPFYPVPMTLQTLAVLMIGAAYGMRLAGATLALYLLEGLIGLPVFAGEVAGPAYAAGPTGGYLVGFVAAAALVGWLAERGWDRSLFRLIAAMATGHVVVFVFGFAWLAALFGAQKAWIGGVEPFIAGTIVKTLLAAALIIAFWRGAAALRRRV
ncbi:MAG TPA: biotin transporter BioY [Roseiarcus sp.]|nr:biotin transporter BioY [Roseiarcus sp.]